jgi:hypothetical protein
MPHHQGEDNQMLTEYQAQQLQREMQRELTNPSCAVMKCGLGILIVVALTLIGTLTDSSRDTPVVASTVSTQAAK